MTADEDIRIPLSRRRLIEVGLLSWITMLGIDFLVHGGLLEGLYAQASPFLLPPLEAFNKIPIGYLSFLLLTVLLLWLMVRIGTRGWKRGFVFGLQLGLLTWGAVVVGLLSISTAPINLMAGWWLGQSIELAIAGAVAGYGLEAKRMRNLTLGVVGLAAAMFLITILIQNINPA
jgi:hypothetical protein